MVFNYLQLIKIKNPKIFKLDNIEDFNNFYLSLTDNQRKKIDNHFKDNKFFIKFQDYRLKQIPLNIQENIKKCYKSYKIAEKDSKNICKDCSNRRLRLTPEQAYECYKLADVTRSCRYYINTEYKKYKIPDLKDHHKAYIIAGKIKQECFKLATGGTRMASNTEKPWKKIQKVHLDKHFRFSNKKNKNKIAFCFLVYSTVDHKKVWERFFAHGRGKYNIYSHIKKVTKKTPKWLSKNKVTTSPTGWCSEGLVWAFNNMLLEALENPENKYFVLLSGSCIPLYPFNTIYKDIIKTKKAQIGFKEGEVVLRDLHMFSQHQWMILNRHTAETLVRLNNPYDQEAQLFLHNIRSDYARNGVYFHDDYFDQEEDAYINWMGGCPDEVYPISWFVHVYGPPHTRQFRKYITNREPTYTLWDKNYSQDHPVKFNKRRLRRSRKKICNSNSIFARKFTKQAAKIIAEQCKK